MRTKKRKRMALGPLEDDILRHLSAGDLLMSFLLSGRSSRLFYREMRQRAHARYHYERSVEGLQRKGLVWRNGDVVRLTEKGTELLEILRSRAASENAPWGGKWWFVTYDIPTSHNAFRFELRSMLMRSGFRKLQHSVWIHPHPCREIEVFLKRNRSFRTYVRYFEVLPFAGLETLADWKKLSSI